MARGLGGFARPPRWAVPVIALGAAAIVVLMMLSAHRGELSAAQLARADAHVRASSAAEARALDAERPLQVLVVGDSYTGGSDMGGNGPKNWTSVLRGSLTAAGYKLAFPASAGGGSGYTQPGLRNMTFDQLLKAAPGQSYDLVIVFGSRNDVAPATDVRAAADQVFADAHKLWPKAALMAIGPPWVNGSPPANIRADRDAVATAITQAGGTFVDPLAEGWFTGAAQALIGSDGVHPTDDGHAYLAQKIEPHLRTALDVINASRAGS